MKKWSFAIWLKEQASQNVEIQVAKFLENILDQAAALKKQDMSTGNSKSFSDYAEQVWPKEAIQRYTLVLPGSLPPDVAGKKVQFKWQSSIHRATTLHYDGKFDGFVINVAPIDKATTPEEIDSYISGLKSTMHHEAEHIFNPGSLYDTDADDDHDAKQRSAINYMSHPGELKAHARQMAYVYSQKFPGEPFDLKKAQSILNHPGFNQTHRNYFQNLSNPGVWDGHVAKYGLNQANPHDQIVSLMPQYLNQYQG